MKKTKLTNAWQFIKRLNTTMVISLGVLLMVMLVSTNYANSQNLERTDLDHQVKQMEDDFRLLNATVSELQTTERLENESKRLELVKIQTKDIYYLADQDERVALK